MSASASRGGAQNTERAALQLITWEWPCPPLAGVNLALTGEELAGLGQRMLQDQKFAQLVAAAAWSAYRLEGRGVLMLPIQDLVHGWLVIRYWRRESLARLAAELPDVADFLEWVDAYDAEREVLVAVMGAELGDGGARIKLLRLQPTPAPPVACAQAGELLIALERRDGASLH